MKILIVNPIIYTSETARVKKVQTIKDSMIYNLCLKMKQMGHEPILIAAEEYKPINNEEYDFEIVFLRTKLKKIFKPNCFPFLKGLRKYLKNSSKNIDFIISSEVFSMSSLLVSIMYKEKTIIWHELAKHNRILKTIPSKIWYNIIAKILFKNTRIVPRSKNAYEFISKYCNNVSSEYIDHGVDLEKFNCENIKKEQQFIVLSQLIPRKRIDGILKIFSEFIKKIDNSYKLYIVGMGEEEKNLKDLTQKLGIIQNVVFKGFMQHKDAIPLLAESKAMVVNTEKDNSMVSIVESIAVGTPIITTTVPYNVDYIQKYKLGIAKEKLEYTDFEQIIKENDEYVNNCKKYREKISNDYHVKQFINEYKKMKEEKN